MLKETNIEGETLVFREVLCEGPTQADFNSAEFWDQRRAFMAQAYGPTNEEFDEKAIGEFSKHDLSTFEEIVLWFEYDLFCQINLMAALSWLNDQNVSCTVSLICAGEEPGHNKLMGLGELTLEEFAAKFPKRHVLSSDDMDYASRLWKAYCLEDPKKLLELADATKEHFPYMVPALESHLTRFPSKNGLNSIENTMLALSQELDDFKKLVGTMLRRENYFGFGDSQYFNYLGRLRPLFSDVKKLELNEKGEQVLSGNAHASDFLPEHFDLGGAQYDRFLWDETKKELLQVQ